MKAYKVVSCHCGRYFSSQMYFDDFLKYKKKSKPWYFREYKIGEKTVAALKAPATNKDLFIYDNSEEAVYDATLYSRPEKPLEAFECEVDEIRTKSRCEAVPVRLVVSYSKFCSEITLTKKLEKIRL